MELIKEPPSEFVGYLADMFELQFSLDGKVYQAEMSEVDGKDMYTLSLYDDVEHPIFVSDVETAEEFVKLPMLGYPSLIEAFEDSFMVEF